MYAHLNGSENRKDHMKLSKAILTYLIYIFTHIYVYIYLYTYIFFQLISLEYLKMKWDEDSSRASKCKC